MAEIWYSKAIRDELLDSGSFTGGPPKGVLHTTEGKSYAGARAAYVKNRSNPHFTVSYEKGYFQCWQHTPINKGSRALRNASGGAQTNRDYAIQIEIVGSCNPPNSNWGDLYVETFPEAYLNGIADLMRWIEANAGVKRESTVTFKAYPGSYGSNGVRLSGAAWDNYNGWCGHQHVPENTHGDPGNINIHHLLGAGVTQDTTLKEAMMIPGAVAAKRVPGGAWNEYIVVAKDGGVFCFNGAKFHGSVPGLGLNIDNIVDFAFHGNNTGYWLIGSDGGVFNFGTAPFKGSYPGLEPEQRLGERSFVGIEAAGNGYYLLADEGGVYYFA